MNRWDKYFLKICEAVSTNSRCLSRQIGAIIEKDRSIIATGYNGPARGIPACLGDTCPRQLAGYKSGEGLHLCAAEHAERNCIANAARMGVCTKGGTMYMTCGVPCKNCLTLIINAGISSIVCTSFNLYDELSHHIILHSHLIIRNYDNEIYGGY